MINVYLFPVRGTIRKLLNNKTEEGTIALPSNYWSRVLDNRISRRRGLTVAGAGVMSAAFLAACGGSDSGGNSGNDTKDKASLVTKPEDTVKQAKKGGILKDRLLGDAPTMDVQQPISPLNRTARHVYNTLVRPKRNYLDETNFDIEPDFAESWEVSPDGLTITMKLRANAKWHNKAPVNGRAVDASDVHLQLEPLRPERSAARPGRQLVQPAGARAQHDGDGRADDLGQAQGAVVYVLQLLASFGSFTGNVVIIPKEVESGFDIRRDMIGTGPFYLDNYTPSVVLHSQAQRRLLGRERQPRRPDQLPDRHRERGGAVPAQGRQHPPLRPGRRPARRGHLPAQEGRPAAQHLRRRPRDEVDRHDLRPAAGSGNAVRRRARAPGVLDVLGPQDLGRRLLQRPGPRVRRPARRTPSGTQPCPPTSATAWLDPQGKDFGHNAKYYQYNVAEAKKLLAAAGHANGVNVKSNRITTNLIANLSRYAEALEGMAAEAGFKTTINAIDYNTEYIPQVRDANGQYEGVGFHTVTGTTPWRIHPASALASEYWSKAGATFKGFSTSGKNDKSGDPAVDSIIEKLRLEKDGNKRKSMMQDLQQDLAK